MSIAEHSRLMREVNNRIYETLTGMGTEDGDFLCECGDETCSETVQLTLREYRGITTRLDQTVVHRRGRSSAPVV